MEQWLSTSNLKRAVEYAKSTGNRFPRILYVCPRQSGKTTALFDTFLETPDSIFMTTFGHSIREFRTEATRRNPRGDNLRPMYDVLALSGTNTLRGRMRRFSTLFIDDIDRYWGDMQYFLDSTLPVMQGNQDDLRTIIAAMTPSGNRTEELYANYFNVIRRIDEVDRIVRSDFDRDHFNDEDFTI